MSELNADQFGGAVASTQEGDPGKYAYLRNPNWRGKLFSRVSSVDDRCCPGCVFSATKRPTPHVSDDRCQVFRTAKAAADIEAGKTKGAERSEVDALTERLRRAGQ
jgi:hypothetical protein